MHFSELQTHVRLVNDKIQFLAESKDYAPLMIDYAAPIGDGQGYSPLELILIGLSSCLAASAKIVLTRHLGKEVRSLRVEAKGMRRTEHPTSFERISLRLFVGVDLPLDELQRVVSQAAEKLCPVYDLLKGNVAMAIETIKEETVQ